jgi:hypothetical protein
MKHNQAKLSNKNKILSQILFYIHDKIIRHNNNLSLNITIY